VVAKFSSRYSRNIVLLGDAVMVVESRVPWIILQTTLPREEDEPCCTVQQHSPLTSEAVMLQ
jgi:hypothetical protein